MLGDTRPSWVSVILSLERADPTTRDKYVKEWVTGVSSVSTASSARKPMFV